MEQRIGLYDADVTGYDVIHLAFFLFLIIYMIKCAVSSLKDSFFFLKNDCLFVVVISNSIMRRRHESCTRRKILCVWTHVIDMFHSFLFVSLSLTVELIAKKELWWMAQLTPHTYLPTYSFPFIFPCKILR